MRSREPLKEGETFGSLTVKEIKHKNREGKAYYKCECSCGAVKTILGASLKNGKTRSCGNRSIHQIKHGLAESSEYLAWSNMKHRCLNVNDVGYEHYGARGIVVYPPWINSFAEFFEHIGSRPSKYHSLNRIDNDGNYWPGNVEWATNEVQANNKRNNHLIKIANENLTLAEASKKYGVNRTTIRSRVLRGLTGKDLIRKVKSPIRAIKNSEE